MHYIIHIVCICLVYKKRNDATIMIIVLYNRMVLSSKMDVLDIATRYVHDTAEYQDYRSMSLVECVWGCVCNICDVPNRVWVIGILLI